MTCEFDGVVNTPPRPLYSAFYLLPPASPSTTDLPWPCTFIHSTIKTRFANHLCPPLHQRNATHEFHIIHSSHFCISFCMTVSNTRSQAFFFYYYYYHFFQTSVILYIFFQLFLRCALQIDFLFLSLSVFLSLSESNQLSFFAVVVLWFCVCVFRFYTVSTIFVYFATKRFYTLF
jgi:hypothetical protein